MILFDFITEAWTSAKLKHFQRTEIGQKAKIAEAFNVRYTHREEWIKNMPVLGGTAVYGMLPRGGFAWMCPSCNKIHHPISCSVFSGLQYPRCCGFPEGHRLYTDGIS
jgi:hypothetical protein